MHLITFVMHNIREQERLQQKAPLRAAILSSIFFLLPLQQNNRILNVDAYYYPILFCAGISPSPHLYSTALSF